MKAVIRIALAAILAAAGGAPDAGAAGDVIKIGILNDQTGVFADNGGVGSIVAARLAAEDFGNSVLGKRIEIVAADHQNKPDIASATARRWFDLEGVDAIADGAASSAGLAILEVARQKGKIFLISGPASSDFTGKFCSPVSFHFTYDTYALSKIAGQAVTARGGDSWFFITADYAFGHALERDTSAVVKAAGGKVLGSVRHPLGTDDFSSLLLQAQASRAKVVGLATSGRDVQNAIKQASEFGIVQGGQSLAGLLVFITDVNALGLNVSQGLQIATSFYWDLDEATRAWGRRFMEAGGGRVPSMVQAGVYSGVHHYLAAVKAAGTDDPTIVAKKMHEMLVNDMYNKDVRIREDGRVLHDIYLVQVKSPDASKYRYDYYSVLSKTPGAEAFRPLSDSECPLVARKQ